MCVCLCLYVCLYVCLSVSVCMVVVGVVVLVVVVVCGDVCEGGCACWCVRVCGVVHSLLIATSHDGVLVLVAGPHASPKYLPVKSFSSSSWPRRTVPP